MAYLWDWVGGVFISPCTEVEMWNILMQPSVCSVGEQSEKRHSVHNLHMLPC